MLKAVIFDLDGTLGDTLPLCIAAFRKAIEPRLGRHVSEEEIVATFGPSEEGTIMALIPEFFGQALDDYLKYYRELHGMCPEPFDGMREIIRFLRENQVFTALVTGKGAASCEISLVVFGMEDCFDWIETGSAQGQRKAEGIREMLAHLDVRPEEAVYVGDTVSDIRCARNAGVPVVSALWGGLTSEAEIAPYHPDWMFGTVEEFGGFLKGKM